MAKLYTDVDKYEDAASPPSVVAILHGAIKDLVRRRLDQTGVSWPEFVFDKSYALVSAADLDEIERKVVDGGYRYTGSALISAVERPGGCPEDCSYCPQAARYDTDVTASRLMAVSAVVEAAKAAKAAGASRYCLGAAWRSPKDRDLDQVCDMVRGIKAEGMEACVTLGMLTPGQTARLKQAGLDYYNHNIDTSPEHYGDIITTRTIEDRLNTIENVRSAGINVCSGGIVGLGESQADRAGMLQTLANMAEHPESVPINQLVRVEGTPLSDADGIDAFDFVRTIAVARILMPQSAVRLSAGRAEMADEAQALCFLAGANSIFFGDKLLTTENPQHEADMRLFARLGINPLN